MPTINLLLLIVRGILLSTLAALAAAWAIRKFTDLALAWKAAVYIGVVNGIISSIIIWSSN